MSDIETDVLIIGTGPAGGSMAALLSSYGIENMVINRYRWLANTPLQAVAAYHQPAHEGGAVGQ